jgi:hypothetical protein
MRLVRRDVMEVMNRRSALALGLSAGTLPLLALATPAAAAMYAADAGKEIMPGIRQVDISKGAINFGGYKSAVVTDYIIGPGAGFPEEAMKNDMICEMMEGEVWVKQGDQEFTAKAPFVFACATGSTEEDKNQTDAAAVMRVIDLMPT